MAFKILHHFIGDDGVLRNIFFFESKEEQWQWIPFGYEPINLTFKSASGNTRTFEEGRVNFDHMGCTFHYFQKPFRLNRSK